MSEGQGGLSEKRHLCKSMPDHTVASQMRTSHPHHAVSYIDPPAVKSPDESHTSRSTDLRPDEKLTTNHTSKQFRSCNEASATHLRRRASGTPAARQAHWSHNYKATCLMTRSTSPPPLHTPLTTDGRQQRIHRRDCRHRRASIRICDLEEHKCCPPSCLRNIHSEHEPEKHNIHQADDLSSNSSIGDYCCGSNTMKISQSTTTRQYR